MNIPIEISSNDFVRLFEKKLRKEIRELELNKEVEVIDTEDSNYFVLNHFLEKNRFNLSKGGQRIYPSSMEEKGRDLLKMFFESGNEEDKRKQTNERKEELILMLTSFTQEEIDKIAKMLGYKGEGRDKDEIIKMMAKLDDKFKNIKTSLVKSSDAIKNALGEKKEE